MAEPGIIPLRSINDGRGVLGLELSDLGCGLIIFSVWSTLFEETPFGILAIPVAGSALLALSPIRLRCRRKIIRDLISYFISSKVIYDPKDKT